MRGLSRRGAGRPAEGHEQHEAPAAGAAAAADEKTRRRLLAWVAGALGVAAAEVVGQAGPAQAATASPVLLGTDNGYPTTRTSVFTSGQKEWAQLADPGNAGLGSLGIYAHGQTYGVYADTGSNGGIGVNGIGNGTGSGVIGTGGSSGGTGVHGTGGVPGGSGVEGFGAGSGSGVGGVGGSTDGIGVVGDGGGLNGAGVQGNGAAGSGTGVVGVGGDSGTGVTGTGGGLNGAGVVGTGGGTAAGVTGIANSTGDGVKGFSKGGVGVHGVTTAASGVGVLAENQGSGVALQANGPAVFSRSGLVTIAAGKTSATVTGVALSSASLVLATLQQHVTGVYVVAAVPSVAGSSFIVYLNKAPTATARVAWFVVN